MFYIKNSAVKDRTLKAGAYAYTAWILFESACRILEITLTPDDKKSFIRNGFFEKSQLSIYREEM